MKPPVGKTRVLVQSDEDIVTAGLRALVDAIPSTELIEERPDDLHLGGVDVVLLHLNLSADADTAALDRLINIATPAIVVLTDDAHPEFADRALARGVDGCISLTSTSDELDAVISSAAWGDLAGDRAPEAMDYTANPADAAEHPRKFNPRLSQREDEVLRLIGTGMGNQEIADELFLSINSVKTHIRSVYRKIDVDSRSKAVLWFMHHLYDDPSTHSNPPPHDDGAPK